MPNFIFLSLFPQLFHNYFQISIAKKAFEKKFFSYRVYNIRNWAIKGQVDDYIYGGGAGMLLKIDCLVKTLAAVYEEYPKNYIILLSPQGKTFTQKDVSRLLQVSKNLIFICGHYEGFDERISNYIDEEISIGDFVTNGGEMPALVIVDSLIRGIPGVIRQESYLNDSFSRSSELDFASYTRPEVFEGLTVPLVLLSGNHQAIGEWRKKNSLAKTQNREKGLIGKEKKLIPNANRWRLSLFFSFNDIENYLLSSLKN